MGIPGIYNDTDDLSINAHYWSMIKLRWSKKMWLYRDRFQARHDQNPKKISFKLLCADNSYFCQVPDLVTFFHRDDPVLS
jgi:hypothetical protein